MLKPIELATLTAPLARETKVYVSVELAGAGRWFGRGTLTALAIADGRVTLTVARKALERRGLLALAA